MASKGTEVLDPAALKAQHAIVYDINTSEIKDDIIQLLACFKTGHGALTRQESGFLLWYHAMDGEDKQAELVANGAVNACLALLDAGGAAPDAGAPEKTCAAGILVALCDGDESREAVARGKGACGVLHALLRDHRDAMQLYAARALRLLASDATARGVLLRAMEGRLGAAYSAVYVDILVDCASGHVVGQTAHFLVALLEKRDDLRGEAVEHAFVEATLAALRRHKMDSAAGALLKLLTSLLEDRAAWARLHAHGGIVMLVDLLGPPPQSILDLEMQQFRSVLDPGWAAAQEAARLEAARQAEEAKAKAGALEAVLEGAGVGKEGSTTPRDKPRRPPSTQINAGKDGDEGPQTLTIGEDAGPPPPAAATSPTGQSLPLATTGPAGPAPHVDVDLLLSTNHSGLKWRSIVSLQTYCSAAACLYTVAQSTEYMQVMSQRLAASRLVPLLHKVMDTDADAGKKKGKKKGLALSPEQTQMLVSITGCLKFLSLQNANKYRIAALGAVKPLALIYNECGHTLLRRNAQVVLSNMALLAENGQVLLDGGLPEEFLVPRPLRLSPAEIEVLLQEFPSAAIGPNAAKAAAAAAAVPAKPGSLGAAVAAATPAASKA